MLALAIVYRFAPAEHSFYPSCPFLRITGWECPGCGGTRALHALMHLRWAEAMAFNPIVTVAFPLLMAIGLAQYLAILRTGRIFAMPVSRNGYAAIITTLLFFGLGRNLTF